MSDYVIRRVSRICEDVGNVEELHLRNGIEYLNLHGNKLLNTLGFTNLSSLTELDMSTNSISSVSNLESLVCLRSLNLSNNILSEIHPSSFNSLVSLKQLNLRYTFIFELIYGLQTLRGHPEYLNDTNNAGFYHPIKTLDFRIGRLHWSDLEGINQSNAQIPNF